MPEIRFEKGSIIITRLDNYITSHWKQQSISPAFLLLFYIQSILRTMMFVASASLLTLVLFSQNNQMYKFVIALILASGLVPIFIYLKHRKSLSENADK